MIKFEEALQSAAIPYTRDPRVAKLFESKQKYKDMEKDDNWLEMLKEKIEDIDKGRQTEWKKGLISVIVFHVGISMQVNYVKVYSVI